MAKRSGKCVRKQIRFKTKRGKTISFTGKQGASCGPRPKPKTGHLRPFKAIFKRAAKACKGTTRGRFLQCMKSNTKNVRG